MTTQPKTIDEIRTWLTNSYGVSEEDAANIISGVSTFAIASYMQSEADRKPAVPQAGQGVTMVTVKAYVDGRLEGMSRQFAQELSRSIQTRATSADSTEGVTLSGHAHGTQTYLREQK